MSRMDWVSRSEDGKTDAFDYNDAGELKTAQYGLDAPPSPGSTPTPTPPPASQVAPVTFGDDGHRYPNAAHVSMSCATAGATIFYTTNNAPPTHSANTPGSGTQVYSGTPVAVLPNTTRDINALAYKSGMTDSCRHGDLHRQYRSRRGRTSARCERAGLQALASPFIIIEAVLRAGVVFRRRA